VYNIPTEKLEIIPAMRTLVAFFFAVCKSIVYNYLNVIFKVYNYFEMI